MKTDKDKELKKVFFRLSRDLGLSVAAAQECANALLALVNRFVVGDSNEANKKKRKKAIYLAVVYPLNTAIGRV